MSSVFGDTTWIWVTLLSLLSLISLSFLLTMLFSASRTFRPKLLNARPPFSVTDVTFTSADGFKISAWWSAGATNLPGALKPAVKPWVILCHGVGHNRADLNSLAKVLHDKGFGTLQFDFRAHGESSGKKISFGHREQADVVAAVKYLIDDKNGDTNGGHNIKDRGLALFGLSMGAVSICLAAEEIKKLVPNLKAVVLDSCYAQFAPIIRISAQEWPLLARLLFLPLVTFVSNRIFQIPAYRMNPILSVGNLAGSQLLFIHSRDDTFIPFAHAEKLYGAAKEPKQSWWLQGCDHSETFLFNRTAYQSKLLEFLSH